MGAHIDKLYRVGVVPLAKQHRKEGGKYKSHFYGPVPVKGGKLTTVDIHFHNAWPCFRERDVKADEFYVPLEKARIKPKLGRTGTYEFRGTWKIPDDEGGGTINLRLDETKEDPAHNFNRCENLRGFSEHWDPEEYSHLAGSRNDTESGNRTVKRQLVDKRGRSLGGVGKHLDLIGHAFSQNAMTRYELRLERTNPLAA